MYQVRVRELKNQTGEIMRRVRDGERIALTYHGRVVAHVVPVTNDYTQADVDAALDDLDALAAEISALPLGPIDAVQLVREQRGEA
jgi:prevent-host-death family protein